MIKNLERYKTDLDNLIKKGGLLWVALMVEYHPGAKTKFKKLLNDPEKLKIIPDFNKEYQLWYSEALELIRQIIPSRLDDFINYYKPNAKSRRKEIDCENYTISDCLNGIVVTRGVQRQRVVGPEAAIGKLEQQLNIVKSLKRKFESTLFDIKQLLQADLFDSEIDAATELNKKGFIRGAGAVAGVVLESHLLHVLKKHNIKVTKKDPSINDLNQLLKDNNVIELPTWRFIQHLADLRNLCDHKKNREPKKEEVEELIIGVDKTIKTIY